MDKDHNNTTKITSPAPIILFVYNRPLHTQQTIEALQKNNLADQSDLIIYSDASKNDQASSQVQAVRNYIKTVNGFKSVKIIERDKNWGLAANIIDGVSAVVNQYGKIIVMEDDIVTSPAYLSFMNQALDFYQNENKAWHISGWNYPIDASGLGDAFFLASNELLGLGNLGRQMGAFRKEPTRINQKLELTSKTPF